MARQVSKNDAEAIRYLIHCRLKAAAEVETAMFDAQAHLDEDTIGAFVEGRLGESESGPIVSHLVACGSCRGATAQSVRLESQVSSETDSTTTEDSPNRLRQLLEDLASQVIPSSTEHTVFAYQNPTEADRKAEVTSETTPDEPKPIDSSTESEHK